MMVRQKEEGEREGRNVRLRKRMSAGKQNNELAENVGNFPGSGILVFLLITSSQNPGVCLSGTSSTNRIMTRGQLTSYQEEDWRTKLWFHRSCRSSS